MPEDKIYSVTMEDGVFTMTFTAPKQLLFRKDWEDLVWDQTLRLAHEAGVMPVGPVFITAEDVGEQTAPLVEGETLTDRIQRWNTNQPQGILGPLVAPDLVKVTGTVQVGLQI